MAGFTVVSDPKSGQQIADKESAIMTDQEIADKIRATLNDLNALMFDAGKARICVDMEIIDISQVGFEYVSITAKISKRL